MAAWRRWRFWVEAERFDRIVQRMASGLGRRRLLGALSGGVAALLGLGAVSEGEARKNKKRKNRKKARVEGPCGNGGPKANRCKRNRQCCTGFCKKKRGKKYNRCRCRREGQSCTENRNCCPRQTGRTCIEGTCQLTELCIPLEGACSVEGDPCCDGLDCIDNLCLPVSCGSDTCPTGCCDTNGDCVEPIDQNDELCGEGGQSCFACSGPTTCWNGTCAVECNSTTCAQGCCASEVDCILFTDQDDETCGAGGVICVECGPGEDCIDGECLGTE